MKTVMLSKGYGDEYTAPYGIYDSQQDAEKHICDLASQGDCAIRFYDGDYKDSREEPDAKFIVNWPVIYPNGMILLDDDRCSSEFYIYNGVLIEGEKKL